MKKLLSILALLVCLPLQAANTHVLLKTNLGNIEIELADAQAPITVANFLGYVDSGQYNSEIFHRVIPGFVAQGGGYLQDLSEPATRAPIINEANNGLKNKRGTIAMARTSDPNSATSQFFINLVDNPALDYTAPTATGWGYAVFGNVVNGMSVVDAMAAIPTFSYGPFDSLPSKLIQITSAVRVVPFSAAATATGTLTHQVLQATLTPATTDVGQSAAIFVAAILPNNAIYVLSPSGWVAYNPNSPAAYSLGTLQATNLTIVNGLDLSGLVGTNIYVGYGLGQNSSTALADLLSNNRLSLVYTVH